MFGELRNRARRAATVGLLATGLVSGGAQAILLNRGPSMVYDTVLDITWTRQAGDGALRNFADAKAWAADFSINDPTFGLIDDWRLPYASVSAPNGGVGPVSTLKIGIPCTGDNSVGDETACRDNEMAYMFFYNLDADFGDVPTGTQTAVGGEELTGIQASYRSGTEFDSDEVWQFIFIFGVQTPNNQGSVDRAWAVRQGDVGDAVAAVPEPASFLLLGVGALGLVWSRRRVRGR